MPLIYDELRKRAGREMAGQSRDHTLHATALVNEVFVKLFRDDQLAFQNRDHFFGLAARAMRSVLIDHARAKGRLKRKAAGEQVRLDDLADAFSERSVDLDALGQALDELEVFDPVAARMTEIVFFGGFTFAEASRILGIPLRTVERTWKTTKAWLRNRIS